VGFCEQGVEEKHLEPMVKISQEDGEKYVMLKFIICTLHPFLWQSNQKNEIAGSCIREKRYMKNYSRNI
jgi:hypothetical protein